MSLGNVQTKRKLQANLLTFTFSMVVPVTLDRKILALNVDEENQTLRQKIAVCRSAPL